MTLPIYQQTRSAVPCEWVYDDDLDDDLGEPSRWDVLTDHTVVAVALGSYSFVLGALLFLSGWPA